MPLFEKGRRPLKPTEICIALATEGRKIMQAGASASEVIAGYTGGKAGLIRVGGTPVFMDGVVSHLIAKFQLDNPAIRVDQNYGFANDLARQLESSTLDIGIVPMEPEAVAAAFTFEEILPGRNIIACGITHPLAQKSEVRLTDVATYPWIAPPANSPLYQDLQLVLKSIGVTDFKVSFSGGSLSSIVNLLARTDSLTVLPLSVVFMLRKQKLVSALSVRVRHPKRNLGILTATTSAERPAIRRFKQFLRAEFTGLSEEIARYEQSTGLS